MNEKPWVKSYCGGKPNYCTPVDETAKGEHEPLYMDMSQVPTGMPDWKPGMVFPAPKKEWVGLTDEERKQIVSYINDPFEWSHAIEAKLKEKNVPQP
jgi:hypothetical protein